MDTLHRNREASDHAAAQALATDVLGRVLALLRIAFGLTFLWAFFDKLLGLGFSTGAITDSAGTRTGIDFMAKNGAWLNGGSPTDGFLSHVPAHNPFEGVWHAMAGNVVVDWLFMLGLLGIGVALTFGIGMRIFGAAGVAMYLFMWLASLPLVTNPVIDDHMLGALTVAVLALSGSGRRWGLGKVWAKSSLVRRNGLLQ